MATTPLQALPYPSLSDPPNGPAQFQALALAVEPKLVMYFASAAARTAAIVAPVKGMVTYIGATDSLSSYNGSAWVDWAAPAGPRGTLAYTAVVSSQTGITTLADLTGAAATVTVPAGRRLRVTGTGLVSSTVTSDQVELHVREGATSLNQANTSSIGSAGATAVSVAILTPAAGTHTYKLSAGRGYGSSGTVSTAASGSFPVSLLVEDIGGI